MEVRLNGAVAWRIFGFFDPYVAREFVVLIVGKHKDQVYTPKQVLTTAKQRKVAVEADGRKAISCDRPE